MPGAGGAQRAAKRAEFIERAPEGATGGRQAVAALPQNNTTRIFFDYITGDLSTSQEHTVAVRLAPGVDISSAQNYFYALLNAMGSARFNTGWRVLRVRVQAANSNFSVPAILSTNLTNFVGTGGAATPTSEAVEWTYQGRSPTSGRRVDLSLYGVASISLNTQFRVSPTEAPWLTGAIAVLQDTEGQAFITIDGTPANWYPYLNWNYNSYWERELRS